MIGILYWGYKKWGNLLEKQIVIINDTIKENFRFYMKQQGAPLAKGATSRIQVEFLERDSFFLISQHTQILWLEI